MKAYAENIDSNYFNISIDGFSLIGEDISPNESFNRRETSRKNIIGGTQSVVRTNYIHKDFNFTAHLRIDPLYPDIYDETLQLWQSKTVEVISKELGGKFNAECIVKRKHDSPSYLTLDIQLIEIPEATSNIPNDTFAVPTDKITKSSTKDKNKNKKGKDKNKNKKGSKKHTKKTTKKSGKNSKKKNSKKKGSKITKVNK